MNNNNQDIVYDRLCCIDEEIEMLYEQSLDMMKMTEKLLNLLSSSKNLDEDNKC